MWNASSRFVSFMLLLSCSFLCHATLEVMPKVEKRVLENGLTVLARQTPYLPDVAVHILYNVGSKDEQTNEKGIAHLLEHTVFQGSALLAEKDIDIVAHKLSGMTNAHTGWDYTCYLFSLPKRHWFEALPMLADCMSNCKLSQDTLNAEFKAVIQELKMYRDDYNRTLFQEMVCSIFTDHPYHFPIGGFKQDIWDIQSEDLHKFYKKHYIPNNAVLVIVGDIDPQDALDRAEKAFAHIPKNPAYKKQKFYHNKDVASTTVTLYRDIQKPVLLLAFVVPGLSGKVDYEINTIAEILGGSNSARLPLQLVEEKKLATSVSADTLSLFDYSLLIVRIEPTDVNQIDAIIKVVHHELKKLADEGATDLELTKVMNQIQSSHFDFMENPTQQAEKIGRDFLATGNEHHAFSYINKNQQQLAHDLVTLTTTYLRPCFMHKGMILPLSQEDKQIWQKMQQAADEEDALVLKQRVRESAIEAANYANTVQPKPLVFDRILTPCECTLSNGLRVLYCHTSNVPKISVSLRLQAQEEYEDKNTPGLYNFMTSTLMQSTTEHTFKALRDLLESHAIDIQITPGNIELQTLSSNVNIALTTLTELLTKPAFEDKHIEKLRLKTISSIKSFWDSPDAISSHLLRQELYKEHPLQSRVPTPDSIRLLSKEQVIDCYNKFITPVGACITIVGDLSGYDVQELLEKTLGSWTGKPVPALTYPALQSLEQHTICYPMQRDQVVLLIGTHSISRNNPDFYPLSIATSLLSQGMNSRLFALRDRTGLFYSIGGSFVYAVTEQPGIVFIKTIVSPDNVERAKQLIMDALQQLADSITEQEVEEAKEILLNNTLRAYATNNAIVDTIEFLARFNLPWDFYEKRVELIKSINATTVKNAVKTLLTDKQFVTVQVGRVQNNVQKN